MVNKSSAKKTMKKSSAKKTMKKPSAKKTASKPSAKKNASRPSAKKTASKPSAKKTASKPSSKKAAGKSSAKKSMKKPSAKKAASKPSAKKTASKSTAMKTAKKPSAKKDADKPPSVAFKYMTTPWIRFKEDFLKLADNLTNPVVQQLCEFAVNCPPQYEYPSLPVFACVLDDQVVRGLTECDDQGDVVRIIHVCQWELSTSLSCARFEERIKNTLAGAKKMIVFLDDTSMWTNKVHFEQARILKLLAFHRQHTCPGLVAVLNFRNWPVDDFYFESKQHTRVVDQATSSPGVFCGSVGNRIPQVCYVAVQDVVQIQAATFSIDAKAFAERLVHRMVSETSFNITVEGADWLYQRARVGRIGESFSDCLKIFEQVESKLERVLTKKPARAPKQSFVSPFLGSFKFSTTLQPSTIRHHIDKFIAWKKHILDKDLTRLEQVLAFVLRKEDKFREWEPYQLRAELLSRVGRSQMPIENDLEDFWISVANAERGIIDLDCEDRIYAMKSHKKSNDTTASKNWYNSIMKDKRYFRFNACLTQSLPLFEAENPSSLKTDPEIEILKKMAKTKGSSMMGDIGQLYRWFERNGTKMVMPTTEKKGKKMAERYSVPDFELQDPEQASKVLSEQCMDLLDSKLLDLWEKRHFGRVWVADPEVVAKCREQEQSSEANARDVANVVTPPRASRSGVPDAVSMPPPSMSPKDPRYRMRPRLCASSAPSGNRFSTSSTSSSGKKRPVSSGHASSGYPSSGHASSGYPSSGHPAASGHPASSGGHDASSSHMAPATSSGDQMTAAPATPPSQAKLWLERRNLCESPSEVPAAYVFTDRGNKSSSGSMKKRRYSSGLGGYSGIHY